MSRQLIATYEMIRGYRYKPTNYWLAISEFIDNSIGSYQENDPENPIAGLMINITLDWRDDDNWKIKILDNARGMNPTKLEESMQPCDRKDKNDKQYNQYGVGMKLGIFWFGENGRVFSKQKNNFEHNVDLITENVDLQKEVIVEAVPSNENKVPYSSGTCIEISKVYKERNILVQKNALNQLKDALGWRYNKLIDKGLKIYLTILSNDSKKSINNEEIKPYFNKPFQLSQLFENENSKITIEQRKDEYIKKFEELFENKKNVQSNFFISVWNKIINDEPVEVIKKIHLNGHDVDLKVCIMDANKSYMNQYCGLTIYHMDRAIMHGPNREQSSNMQFVERSSGSGSKPTYRWLYGELNLTGIEIPDENKSRFMWSENGEEELKSQLAHVFDELEDVLKIIARINDISTNKKPTKSELNKIGHNIHGKIKTFTKPKIIERDGNNGISGKCIICNDEYDVEIFESDDVNFLHIDANEIEKKISIFIERENKFWKPFIKQDDFKEELLYPIAIYLGVSDWIYNNENIMSVYDQYKSKSFIEVLTTIIKEWS